MKMWRKHNSSKFVRENPEQKLVKKEERRTRYSSEEKIVSQLVKDMTIKIFLETYPTLQRYNKKKEVA